MKFSHVISVLYMHILLYRKCFWKYKVTVTTVFFLHVHVADFGVAGQLTVSHNAH